MQQNMQSLISTNPGGTFSIVFGSNIDSWTNSRGGTIKKHDQNNVCFFYNPAWHSWTCPLLFYDGYIVYYVHTTWILNVMDILKTLLRYTDTTIQGIHLINKMQIAKPRKEQRFFFTSIFYV